MNFKERIKQDLNTFFNIDEFSEEIVYKSAVVRAIVDFSGNLELDDSNASQMAQIQVLKDDVPEPQFGDLVVFQGKNWTMERVISGDDETWILAIRRDERVRFRS